MPSIGPPGSPGPAGFPPNRSSFFEQWFNQDRETHEIAARIAQGSLMGFRAASVQGAPAAVQGERNELLYNPPPEFALGTILTLGERGTEGRIVEAVSIPWLRLLDHLKHHPEEWHLIGSRKWEQIIAAAYKEAGWEVELTGGSGDQGRDVIATLAGIVTVRCVEQVKAYAPGNKVPLTYVHAMMGVLDSEPNFTKGVITTTSDFAPGVYENRRVQERVPGKLELRPRDKLFDWLTQIVSQKK